MTLRRLSLLQWIGLLGPPLVWAGQHVVGYGLGEARCSPASGRFGIGYDTWQLALLGSAVALVLAGQTAAAIVFVRTRAVSDDASPPQGRMHFFAAAALVANLLFLGVIVLDGVASVLASLCRQS